MKVSTLIELLQDHDPDLEVHIAYGAGDYWQTQVAPAVDTVDVDWVRYSSYHRKPTLGRDNDDDEPARQVLIIA